MTPEERAARDDRIIEYWDLSATVNAKVAAAVLAERKACAELARDMMRGGVRAWIAGCRNVAAAIEARK